MHGSASNNVLKWEDEAVRFLSWLSVVTGAWVVAANVQPTTMNASHGVSINWPLGTLFHVPEAFLQELQELVTCRVRTVLWSDSMATSSRLGSLSQSANWSGASLIFLFV
jgi:hypothetical protein